MECIMCRYRQKMVEMIETLTARGQVIISKCPVCGYVTYEPVFMDVSGKPTVMSSQPTLTRGGL